MWHCCYKTRKNMIVTELLRYKHCVFNCQLTVAGFRKLGVWNLLQEKLSIRPHVPRVASSWHKATRTIMKMDLLLPTTRIKT